MAELFDSIQRLVAQDRYVVGQHASERLEERGIMEWQVVAELAHGHLIAEKPDAKPHPAIEVSGTMPDGASFKAIWSHLPKTDVAKLVTVHFIKAD